jgi:hypothetical protein
MARSAQYVAQGLVLAIAVVLVGYLSNAPTYHRFPIDEAQVLLSLSHGAKPKGKCRTLSAEDVARTAANMRRLTVCPRERLPMTIEIVIDGRRLFHRTVPPGGLAGDSPSRVYQRFSLPTGRHRLTARLRDSARSEGFDHERTADIDLAPRQRLVIDFRANAGGFVFR